MWSWMSLFLVVLVSLPTSIELTMTTFGIEFKGRYCGGGDNGDGGCDNGEGEDGVEGVVADNGGGGDNGGRGYCSRAAVGKNADLRKNSIVGFSAGLVDESNLFEWSVIMFGPPDSLYEGGIFNAIMTFPQDYPLNPPSMSFTSEVWHPNVYLDGKVCISILNPAGDDPYGYELASERWNPVHTVESIVVSIISLLSSPNDEAPANVEAAKECRENKDEFTENIRRCVTRSKVKFCQEFDFISLRSKKK